MHRHKIPAKLIALALVCLFCARLFSQEGEPQQRTGPPSVAIIEPFVSNDSSKKMPVKAFDKFTVRETLSQYLTRSKRYRVLDRLNIDKIAKEQGFQREGLVDPTKIKEVGKLMGADFVCTLELMRDDDGTFGVSVKLIDVVTAETPFSSYEMTPEYTSTAVKTLAEIIGKQILDIDRSEREMREAEDKADRERRAREAEARDRQDRADRQKKADEEKAKRDADEKARKDAAEKSRQESMAYGASPAGKTQRVNELLPFFNAGSGGTFTHKGLAQYLQARQQAVMGKREEYWHSVIVGIKNGVLVASSKYVCTDAKNQLSHSKITAEIGDRTPSLQLAPQITKSSVIGTITEEAPITNTEWLRAIAANPDRMVTIRLTGPTGVREYAMDDVVHTAIIQTLELYDAQRQR